MTAAKRRAKPKAKKAKAKTRPQSVFAQLRKFALAFPETHEDHPWGDTLIKVRGKTFVFMGESEDGFGMSVKLPRSREFALEYPFTKPTAYGLGKSGWVSAQFTKKDKPPIDLLEAWINESYRAIAPKSILKKLAE